MESHPGPVEQWAEAERERIFANPEEYIPSEHHMIFSDQEILTLLQGPEL